MRYDNWDIILFPEDSNIPIPEYKTACYLSHDGGGSELPILRTYIGSLKPDTPFRISVHHWGPPKHSPLLQQVQRKAGSEITFTVQVLIDGARLYHGSFAVNTSSPQEIAYEQRSYKSSQSHEQPTSKPKQHLLFPQSNKNVLLQSTAWQPCGTDNRIKIILSEQFINAGGSLDADSWDIVCFSFQYAPRELLEQAGIAYPIIDPLRSLMSQRATTVSHSISHNTATRDRPRESRVHSAYSPGSDFEPMPIRPSNPEPLQQPRVRMASMAMYPPQPMTHRGSELLDMWPQTNRPFIDDDVSMGSWPSQRYPSHMTGLDFYDSSIQTNMVPPWSHGTAAPIPQTGPDFDGARRRKDHSAQQVMMALRDDQFGQIMEALSPSRKPRSRPNSLHQQSTKAHHQPKMGALSVPVRPSSAAIGRSAAISDLNPGMQNSTRMPSSGQAPYSANVPLKSSTRPMDSRENQMPIATMYNPFFREPQRLASDISMKDGSSNSSGPSKSRKDSTKVANKIGSAHAPSIGGEVRSRKEGLTIDTSESIDINAHHDEILSPRLDGTSKPRAEGIPDDQESAPHNTRTAAGHGVPDRVRVIDVDAINPDLVTETTADLAKLSPFKPGHTAGMSSTSSTGRLERQLYSALGEELGSFEQQLNTAGMGPELAQALSGIGPRNDLNVNALQSAAESETEVVIKRKRQDTLGGERNLGPTKKKEKVRTEMVEVVDIPEDTPRSNED